VIALKQRNSSEVMGSPSEGTISGATYARQSRSVGESRTVRERTGVEGEIVSGTGVEEVQEEIGENSIPKGNGSSSKLCWDSPKYCFVIHTSILLLFIISPKLFMIFFISYISIVFHFTNFKIFFFRKEKEGG
jgi:hypothetical protein